MREPTGLFPSSPPPPGPAATASGGVALLLLDQRERWERGERALVESYLEQHPNLTSDANAVLDLVYNEVFLREQRGEAPRLEEYVGRFPELAEPLRLQFEVHAAIAAQTVPGTLVASGEHSSPVADRPPGPGGYQIVAELGRGQMGVVYKAWDPALKRFVALKVIRDGSHAGPEELARFRAEAEAAARLQHPHIVQIHAIGEQDGLPYLALEFVAGGTLKQQLAGKPLPAREAAQLVEILARAVHHAHERGIVHRDLKPANILLQGKRTTDNTDNTDKKRPVPSLSVLSVLSVVDCTPKIADFGLAKRLDDATSQTRSGAIMGTPSYMAPEQAAGRARDVGPAADTYALGAILYEALTGRPPFAAATVMETLQQVIDQEPVPPRRSQPGCPRDLETICLKCLRKEARHRYATARELADDLGRFLRHEPIRARPTPAWERALKWARRRPVVAALAVLLTLSLIVGGTGVTVSWRQAEQSALEARQNLYVARLQLARTKWEAGDLVLLRSLLDKTDQPGLRGFEWYYLLGLCHSDRLTLSGRNCVAFSPDGQQVAAAGATGAVEVWDTAGRPICTLRGHTREVAALAFSPNGRSLASAGGDQDVKIWDLTQGAEVTTLSGHTGPVTGVAFAPGGGQLASSSQDGSVKIWDATTGKEARTLRGHTGHVNAVAFSPDGQSLASAGNDETVKLWDARTGTNVLTFCPTHDGAVTCVCFSPNGEWLASGDNNNTIKIWDPLTGDVRRTLRGHTRRVAGVAFSPDGRRLASAGWDRTVKVWDVVRGGERLSLKGHDKFVTGVCFSPDGKWVASASEDQTIKVWDATLRSQEERFIQGHKGMITAVAFGPNGQLATAGYDRSVILHDAAGAALATLVGHTDWVSSVTLGPNGDQVASGSHDNTARLWDATGQELHVLRGHTKVVESVACSPDGKTLATGSADGRVMLWDTRSGAELSSLPEQPAPVTSVCFHPDGRRLASASRDGTVSVWATERRPPRLLYTCRGHTDEVLGVSFSPDGRRLASASKDKTIRLWDLRSGREVATLTGHDGSVRAVAFSPTDSRRLASGSQDGTVKAWDVDTGEEVLTLHGFKEGVAGMAFSRDGLQLAACGEIHPGEVKIWDATVGRQIASGRR